MNLVTGYELGARLLTRFNFLNKSAGEITITIRADELVSITTTSLMARSDSEELIKILDDYHLTKWDLVRFCQTGNGYI